MARKITRKGLVKKADTAFSLYIRARDGHQCVLCGSRDMIQCGHIFSRVAYSTRWDEDNAYAQCASCNMKHEHNAYPFLEWCRKKKGQKKMDELFRKWNSTVKYHDAELEAIAQEYKEKREHLDKA